ncbi:MAG: hypothetical protein HY332_07930 [Chloroflexi bacterium]|nr:hypothetical protein [Chloroflexota bacterium]
MARSLTIREHLGEYGLEVRAGQERFYAVIDTGFTHPQCETGLCVETPIYDRLAPLLVDQQAVPAFTVGGQSHLLRSGVVRAELVGLDDSVVETRLLDGGSNLVGVCFFTRLARYRISWDPAARVIRIRAKR